MTREEILRLADERMAMGLKKYGDFDPATDKRDLILEQIDELVDCVNYSIMQIQKLHRLREVCKQLIAVENGRLVVSMKAIPEDVPCPEA